LYIVTVCWTKETALLRKLSLDYRELYVVSLINMWIKTSFLEWAVFDNQNLLLLFFIYVYKMKLGQDHLTCLSVGGGGGALFFIVLLSPNLIEKCLELKDTKKKKCKIWSCSFQQEILIKFEGKLLIFMFKKNSNVIFVSCGKKSRSGGVGGRNHSPTP